MPPLPSRHSIRSRERCSLRARGRVRSHPVRRNRESPGSRPPGRRDAPSNSSAGSWLCLGASESPRGCAARPPPDADRTPRPAPGSDRPGGDRGDSATGMCSHWLQSSHRADGKALYSILRGFEDGSLSWLRARGTVVVRSVSSAGLVQACPFAADRARVQARFERLTAESRASRNSSISGLEL